MNTADEINERLIAMDLENIRLKASLDDWCMKSKELAEKAIDIERREKLLKEKENRLKMFIKLSEIVFRSFEEENI
jgi:hypothetical protein